MNNVEAVVKFEGVGEHWRKELTPEEIGKGWTTMPCPECSHFDGTGIFVQPDGSKHECVHCSTSGEVMVSLPPAPTREALMSYD